MRIAFVGLGQMGRPMAENLIKAGHTLVVHNRSKAAVNALTAQGALAANSASEALHGSDILMTCLFLPDQLREIYFGPNGILSLIHISIR